MRLVRGCLISRESLLCLGGSRFGSFSRIKVLRFAKTGPRPSTDDSPTHLRTESGTIKRMRTIYLFTRAVLVRLWASPYTLLGVLVGLFFLGRPKLVSGVIEISGPGVAWFLNHLPTPAMAMTLGHTVLGQTPAALDITRLHERVHVRQFERWGILMGPAYLLASAWIWKQGGNAYRDNPFEIEAFAVDDCRGPRNE